MDKQEYQALRKQLLTQKKNGWDRISESAVPALETYSEEYRTFLNACKTERLFAAGAVRAAATAGYVPFERGMALKAGDKVYVCNRGKSVMLARVGTLPLHQGVRIAAAHIDSPRLDLKPKPLYEDTELAYFKTHYYGGIRKYQWPAIPLALYGVIILKDGTTVPINIGGTADDPALVITDLLPHLAKDQNKKKLGEAFSGETLNLLIGSRPIGNEEESKRVKLAVMKLLHEKYGIVEDDFISAELEAVPAMDARDVGLDRSFIGAYGHDDRVCAYAALRALLDLEHAPEKTAVCVLVDKEEIGSEGVTGMRSAAFDTFMEDLCELQGVPVRVCLEHAFCLSTDVTAAYDPNFDEVFEKRNDARLNYGIALCKYTGGGGKFDASDANAETVARIRRIFDDAGVIWQMTDMGKVDIGGGGTIAVYMANRNITTLDAGVPILSMHSPFEIAAKLDCYSTYQGIKALYESKAERI